MVFAPLDRQDSQARIRFSLHAQTTMTAKNTIDSWGVVSRAFHWIIVLLIVFQGTTGLLRSALPRGTMDFHKSVGITILVLAILRVVWRVYAGAPRAVEGTSRWQSLAASAMHGVLYAMIFIVPITGWIVSDSGKRPLAWFGIPMPDFIPLNEDLHKSFEYWHEQMFWVLVVVASAHMLAALYHHLFVRDRTLIRMLKG